MVEFDPTDDTFDEDGQYPIVSLRSRHSRGGNSSGFHGVSIGGKKLNIWQAKDKGTTIKSFKFLTEWREDDGQGAFEAVDAAESAEQLRLAGLVVARYIRHHHPTEGVCGPLQGAGRGAAGRRRRRRQLN